MKKITVEVCVDSIDSLNHAINCGIDRIELCSSLSLGGLTPSFGFTQYALKKTSIPIFVMIRPRSGDFLFNTDEVLMMGDEIKLFRELGVTGVVIGALQQDASIDDKAVKYWMNCANGLEVTFHRAFDLTSSYEKSLEQLISLGCDRVLTSGGCLTAFDGIENLKHFITISDNRISVMPGCGINEKNIRSIVERTGACEIHFSAKSTFSSKMKSVSGANTVVMGSDPLIDSKRDITDEKKIKRTLKELDNFI